MSWLFSQALVEAYSEGTSSGGVACAQWNVMPTPQGFWHNDKMMDASRLSRFGVTLQLLTEDRGEAMLTWFREDFLARTSQSPERGQASREPAADYGLRCAALLAKFDRDTCSWRTFQCSLLEEGLPLLPSLPKWGMMRNGELSERIMPVPLTSVTDSGLSVPTPNAFDATGNGNLRKDSNALEGGRHSVSLHHFVKLWPTPSALERAGTHKPGSQLSLSKAVNGWTKGRVGQDLEECRMIPTPTVSRGDYQIDPKTGEKLLKLEGYVKANRHGNPKERVTGKLNPEWVEWLMGWPMGWTDLRPLAMDKFRQWCASHGKF